jgi:hypothetical protein
LELLELQGVDEGGGVLRLVALVEELLVLGLEQGITRAALPLAVWSCMGALRTRKTYLVSVRMKRPIALSVCRALTTWICSA